MWRKALTLDRDRRALLVEAAWYLVRVWLTLRLLPFSTLAASLDRDRVRRGVVPADIAAVRWAVEAAARHLPISLTCLPQAFAASWMLMARGGRPLLHYGVAKRENCFEAHAWVEQDGKPVVGHREAGRFTELACFPAGKSAPS